MKHLFKKNKTKKRGYYRAKTDTINQNSCKVLAFS